MSGLILCDQRSPQWFAARIPRATGSNFAAVMATIKSGEAATRRNYRAQKVVEILTGKPTEGFTTKAMQDGIDREAMARLVYEARTGNLVQEVGFIIHDSIMAGASPDGLIDLDGVLEIKAPTLATHLEYIYLPVNTCPSEYIPQIQGEMWIAEREWCDFVSYNPEFPERLQIVIRRVFRDDVYIAKLETEVIKFMNEVTEALNKLPEVS
jgi:hypothetical protein